MPSWVAWALAAAALLAGCAGEDARSGDDEAAEASEAVAATSGAPAPPRLEGVAPVLLLKPAAPDFKALPGANPHFGTLGGAAFRIEMPSNWNGELLLWAHGFRAWPETRAENPPEALRRALIDGGYAWAASSFSGNGYIPGAATNDTLALKEHFSEQFGEPTRTYIAGGSMGGHVVALSLENFPGEYDGGLSLCGVVAGGEWIDYQMAWTTAAEFIAGFELPRDQGPEKAAEALESKLFPALDPAGAPTEQVKAFTSVIRNLTGGHRPFFDEGYRAAFRFNFGLATGDPGRTVAYSRAASTIGIDFQADPGLGFDDDAINRGVRRLAPDAELRDTAKHPDTAPTTGKLRDPLLTLHESGDLTVPISMEQSYRRKADAAGAGDLLVQRIIRHSGHCEFSDSEITRAWDDLTAWVSGKGRPGGDDILGDLSDAGRAYTDPLRPGDSGGK
jgi:hypothetical protein